MNVQQNPTFLAARYYVQSWRAIPILLHYVESWYDVWDPDSAQYVHKPICSCHSKAKCSNPGKHPVVGWKQKPMSTPEEGLQTAFDLLSANPNYGLALRTGQESGLVVLDVDIRPDKRGDLALAEGLARYGIDPSRALNTVTQVTGSGGYHYIFRYPRDRKIPTITNHPSFGAGVDVKGEGGMFNVWPSIHKNGNQYCFPWGSDPENIADLPEQVVGLIEKKMSSNPYEDANAALEAYTPNEEDIREFAHRLRTQRKSQKLKEIGRNIEKAVNGEAIFLEGSAHDGFRDMAFQIAHEWPLCDVETVVEFFRPSIEARQRERHDASTGVDNLRDSLETARRKAEEFRLSWAAQLARDSQGQVVSTVSNYMLILRNDPELKDSLYYEWRLKKPALQRQLGIVPGPYPRLVDYDDTPEIVSWMERKYSMRSIRLKDLFACICAVAKANRCVDPFAEYLRNLPPWDGWSRLPYFMQEIAGAEDSEWTRTIMPIWFRGFVRRILEPGFKVDTMLILEGDQGFKKSTFFKSLMPWPALFSDSLHKLKQEPEILRLLHSGPAIFEIGDLAGFNRAQRNELKSFLSATQDSVRPLYQGALNAPRNFVMVGTTNDDAYLRDPTGLRRFLPIKVTRPIDLEHLLQVRDQLFAEALIPGYLDYVPIELIHHFHETELDPRSEDVDPWVNAIREVLDRPVSDPTGTRLRDGVTTSEILDRILEIELKQVTRSEQMRIADCMKALGWKQRLVGKDRVRTWFRITENTFT